MPIAISGEQKLHYLETGSGPATLWIHGAGGNAAIWWQQAEHFARTHKVIAYDHRGFAGSPCPMPEVSVTKVADDALAVLDAAGADSAHVICQSLGGWTGLRLALAAPERVRSLVLSCTMAGVNHAPAIASVLASGAKIDERGPVSITLAEGLHRANPMKAYIYQQVEAFNTGFSAADLPDFFTADTLLPLEALASVTCPVLVISGEEDVLWPPETLAEIAAAFPNGRQEIIPGSGHSPYFEKPEAFNALVEAFINSQA